VDAAERTRHATSAREQAMWLAAVEAADPTFAELERSIVAAQSAEARLFSLVFALREAGARACDEGNAALAAAANIEQRIAATARRRAPPVDPAHGRSLIERLRLDATAALYPARMS
jgi:hypothetical protein